VNLGRHEGELPCRRHVRTELCRYGDPSMTDTDPLPRFTAPGVSNLRDVGGHVTTAGASVRTGVLYRSGHLDHADDAGFVSFAELGLGTVFDLRGLAERELVPGRVPDGVRVLHLDVLADADSSLSANLVDMFTDTAAAEAILRSGDIRTHYLGTYRNLVLLDSARNAYRSLFTELAGSDEVTLFHCTAGKDRTGWAAAALLWLLGVDDDTITDDYLLSNGPVVAAFRPLIDRFAAAGGDPELLIPAFRVEAEYLDASRAAVADHFGSIEEYFDDGLGLGVDLRSRLRERFLVAT